MQRLGGGLFGGMGGRVLRLRIRAQLVFAVLVVAVVVVMILMIEMVLAHAVRAHSMRAGVALGGALNAVMMAGQVRRLAVGGGDYPGILHWGQGVFVAQ